MPSEEIKVDLAYKKFSKRQYTDIAKRWHEEFPGKALNIKMSDVWSEDIPNTPPTVSSAIVEVVEDLVLTHDVTVIDNRSWLACSIPNDLSTRVGDFIQPDQEIPQSYYIRVFDNSGKQIFVGDPVGWEFDYANGVLTFEHSPTSYQKPFHVKGYRYIGSKGVDPSIFANSLDEAYDGDSGSGSGRIIEADFGPVVINPSNGSAALQLNPQSYTPTSDLSDGQIINRNGIIYIYDTSRATWISMNRQTVAFGVKRADGCYLNVSDFSSSMSGWPAMRDGVVTGVTVQASGGYPSKGFSLSINNDPTPLYEFNLTGHYHANGELNIPFNANDIIKILTSSEYSMTYNVIASLEIAWRV